MATHQGSRYRPANAETGCPTSKHPTDLNLLESSWMSSWKVGFKYDILIQIHPL